VSEQSSSACDAADRNLLFGVLAVQNNFIDGEALIAAMRAWLSDKAKPLGRILLEQEWLSDERHRLLEAIVHEHLRKHKNGFYVDVAASIDVRTGIATWTFTTIDPNTGQIPLDPTVGFLPPDNSSGIGEGFVSYTIMANSSDPTGTVINAQATVTFYTQPHLNTAKIFNTIDAGTGLTSTGAPLPGVESSSTFTAILRETQTKGKDARFRKTERGKFEMANSK